MSAEAIAAVYADITAGRTRQVPKTEGPAKTARDLWAIAPPTLVDVSAIYQSVLAIPEVKVYEDHPSIAPPFLSAAFSYVNEHGNVIVMHAVAVERTTPEERAAEAWEIDDWAVGMDWAQVRWTIHTHLWIGGQSHGKPYTTTGPVHTWQFAVEDNGTPWDLHWVQIVPDYPQEHWDMAHLVLLGSLNYLNCRNVDIVEPSRPRAERRRLERAAPGVQVHTINVFPAGKSTRSVKGAPVGGIPLTSVRGHFAHYGACCPHHEPKGKLFGKITGRFFIPQHARGSTEFGETAADYKLVGDRQGT